MIKESFIYLASSLANKSIPFFLLPVLTAYLSPEEYGLLSIYLIIITFYTAFVGMNININVSKNFFRKSKNEFSILMGNILIILSLSFAFFLILTFILSFFIKDIFSIPREWIIAVPVISFLFMTNTLYLTILRNEGNAIAFGLFEIANTALTMGITILLLINYNYGWKSQAMGILLSYFCFSVVSYIYMRRRDYVVFFLDKIVLKDVLKTSLPLIPHVLGGIIMTVSDRLFIENMISLEIVGIYSVGYTFGMIVMLFTDSFVKAWSPWFYKVLSRPTYKEKRDIVKYTYVYIVSVFVLAILISTVANFILPYVVDERYLGANEYIFLIAIGYAVHGVYKIFYPYLVHINKTTFLGFSSALAAVLNLLFNYFLIKELGAIGAAYATILAFLVSSILVFFYQYKNYPMPWNLRLV